MREYTVIGVSKSSGTSKKTGQPYNMTRLYLIYNDPLDTSLVGSGCMDVTPFSTVFQTSNYEPQVGDVITLHYEPGFNGQARLTAIERVGAL